MTAKPFNPTLKVLVETEPESWPALLRQPTGPTTAIDADIATVGGAADKVLRVAAAPAYLLHLEFVAGHDAATPRRCRASCTCATACWRTATTCACAAGSSCCGPKPIPHK